MEAKVVEMIVGPQALQVELWTLGGQSREEGKEQFNRSEWEASNNGWRELEQSEARA